MAIFNVSVSTISRSQGRSATAAAAYRAGVAIDCDRYETRHDYRRKTGVEHREIITPSNAPDWARDRSKLWNAVEASEKRKNSVVAREWRVSLPHELDAGQRIEAARAFGEVLAKRYGVAADIAIHAPGREGDERNYHAHILTTTRRLGGDGLGEKTRELDVKQTSSVEVSAMREAWAGIANGALERAGRSERIDHRSLETQREEAARLAALARACGEAETARIETDRAALLTRAPEPKLGPARSAIERRARREAQEAGRDYRPATTMGLAVLERRAERLLMRGLQAHISAARSAFKAEREQGAGVARAAVQAGVGGLRAEQLQEKKAREDASPASPSDASAPSPGLSATARFKAIATGLAQATASEASLLSRLRGMYEADRRERGAAKLRALHEAEQRRERARSEKPPEPESRARSEPEAARKPQQDAPKPKTRRREIDRDIEL